MKETLDKLFKELDVAAVEVTKIRNAIDALQALCEHNKIDFKDEGSPWRYEGHGHNYDVYVCSICKIQKEH
jgi:hypothetical protein